MFLLYFQGFLTLLLFLSLFGLLYSLFLPFGVTMWLYGIKFI